MQVLKKAPSGKGRTTLLLGAGVLYQTAVVI